jgi:hypothetical protein
MNGLQFTESQIVFALKQAQRGKSMRCNEDKSNFHTHLLPVVAREPTLNEESAMRAQHQGNTTSLTPATGVRVHIFIGGGAAYFMMAHVKTHPGFFVSQFAICQFAIPIPVASRKNPLEIAILTIEGQKTIVLRVFCLILA